jgi:hypothetical protein
VGIIPYDPTLVAYKFCCPNKLSQYFAAGLPVLCTNLDFVSAIVRDNDVGFVFSFSSKPSLPEVVEKLTCDIQQRAEMSHRARTLFVNNFNWEHVSEEFYASLVDRLHSRRETGTTPSPLDFSWTTSKRIMRREVHLHQNQKTSQSVTKLDKGSKSDKHAILHLSPKRLLKAIMKRL